MTDLPKRPAFQTRQRATPAMLTPKKAEFYHTLIEYQMALPPLTEEQAQAMTVACDNLLAELEEDDRAGPSNLAEQQQDDQNHQD